MVEETLSGDLLFPDAFALWIGRRVISGRLYDADPSYMSGKTETDYRTSARALGKFFGLLRLRDITDGHMRAYQQARAVCDQAAGAWTHRAAANTIRKEIAILIRVLREAGLWDELRDRRFQRVRPVQNDLKRALTREQQAELFDVASSRPEFRFMHQYAIIALQSTAGPGELRSIRLEHVSLDPCFIVIPASGAKNRFRQRTIPLVSHQARWAINGLVQRARELGAVEPWHYLFPRCENFVDYDPLQGMSDSGLKRRWNELRDAAEMPRLRIYDLRHTGITRMAEAGVPLAVAMSYAGHMTQRMQQHYTAICSSAQREWGEQVWASQPIKKPPVAQIEPFVRRQKAG
jgi:integrase